MVYAVLISNTPPRNHIQLTYFQIPFVTRKQLTQLALAFVSASHSIWGLHHMMAPRSFSYCLNDIGDTRPPAPSQSQRSLSLPQSSAAPDLGPTVVTGKEFGFKPANVQEGS